MPKDSIRDCRSSRFSFFLLFAFCAGAVLGLCAAVSKPETLRFGIVSGLQPVSVLRCLPVRMAVPLLMLLGGLLGQRRHVPLLFFVRGFCFCFCLCILPDLRAGLALRALISLPVLFQTGVCLLLDAHPPICRLLAWNLASELLAAFAADLIF